jgi:hypothetical protein
MITSVYLSSNKITILTGRPSLNPAFNKITLKKHISYEIPEKLYAGGLILNPDGLAEFFIKIWTESNLPKANISLVLGRGGFITKLFDIPLLSSGNTTNCIPREFTEVGRLKDPIFSYSILSENTAVKQRRIFGVMSERTYIKNYVDIFSRAGLKLVSIDAVQNTMVRLLSKHPSIKKRTCLVQHLEEDELTSFLFVSGTYVYSSTSRLSQFIGDDIVRSVSGIMQFARSQGIECPLTDVFIIDAGKEAYMLCEKSIKQSDPYLTVGELYCDPFIHEKEAVEGPASGAVSSINTGKNLICSLSGFDMIPGKANFIYQQKRSLDSEARHRALVRYSLPFFIILLMYFTCFSILYAEQRNLISLSDKAADYLKSEKVKNAVALYDKYQAELDSINTRITDAVRAGAAIDSYPLMDSSVCDILKRDASGYAEITIVSYDASSGLVGLNIDAKDETLIHTFVDILRSEKILTRVEYRGYDINDDGSFKVDLSCYLSSEAGHMPSRNYHTGSEAGGGYG